MIYFSYIETPLGRMAATADEKVLYSLKFVEGNKPEIKQKVFPLLQIEEELYAYFSGALKVFLTPFVLQGTAFQKSVWSVLEKIPYGQTVSYAEVAREIKNPQGYRAVAQAAARNPCALIIPCHRMVGSGKSVGGYNGGKKRKEWLLEHERE